MEFISSLHPLERIAQATEIAKAALFLLSDKSSFMTGTPMNVNGGIPFGLSNVGLLMIGALCKKCEVMPPFSFRLYNLKSSARLLGLRLDHVG